MFKKFSYLIFVLLALVASAKAQTEEPAYFAIASENIIAAASSSRADQGPENTVNGSGLDARDLHSNEFTDMWLSDWWGELGSIWIQYEFDKIYKLHEMWVWNYNEWLEEIFGSGFKDVTIEYSVNGTDWATLRTSHEFAQAPGKADYEHNTTVDFGGVAAKYVNLTANSNWGDPWGCGLSEVRYIATVFVPDKANPNPADHAIDIPLISSLDWTPTETAVVHDVYFGTVFNDVNEADISDPRSILVSQGQSDATYDPGRLDFSQTYYWRIDEVNAPPDSTIFKGNVWRFTTELFAYPIDGNNITATASSQTEDQGPENTVNGSGLNVNDLHSNRGLDMWLTLMAMEPDWIQYEFDKIYKLHEMWVWNHNGSAELLFGFGCKDVTIEYSVNGTDWATLGTTHEFAQASGKADYAHNTTIDFEGVTAKYVRLTINSNWGWIPQYGLSEVRFLYIPVQARKPSPESGAIDVDVDVILGFRAGREAAEHDVYLSADEQAVIDGTVPVIIVTEASYSPSLDVNSVYYWRVDEVNEAEIPAIWQGEIWNFSTQEYLVLDDFELYNDLEPNDPNSNRISNAWIDGFDDPIINGSIIHDSNQSMSYFYDNNFKFSEAELTLSPAQNWTEHGVTVLVLYFRGEPSNAVEQMYLKVNGFKMLYDGDASDILQPEWRQWSIPLEEFANQGVDLQDVTQLGIGFGDEMNVTAGGSGVVYFDNIRLYRSAPCLEI